MNTNGYKEFMLESNRIEGEDRINPGDIQAIKYTMDFGFSCFNDLFYVHKLLGAYLKEDWVGRFRDCQVYIGKYVPPAPEHVEVQMEIFMKKLPMMDSWEAHNLFESIHPFQDLNGRMGRLIWLQKAVTEGYDLSIPFLQKYYYQTLQHHER